MFYAAEIVDAELALSRGLLDVVLDSDLLDVWPVDCSKSLSSKSTVGIRGFKQVLNEQDRADRQASLSLEIKSSLDCIGDPDTKRRIKEFLDKRKS